jgi:hypothetical protein
LKKVCFVVSHLGSGSGNLVSAINANPRCEIRESGLRYAGASSVRWLFRMGHKCRDASAVYGDHLLFNASVSSKDLYGMFGCIFVIRPARHSLNEILRRGYGESGASSYYRFRLRRMCEMAKRSPGAVLLTWDDLAKERSLRIIEEYLGLAKPLEMPVTDDPADDLCSEATVQECQRAYDRYFYYLGGLDLRRTIEKTSGD